jgi:hypothetical protein
MKKVKDQNSNFKYEISDYFFKINFVTEITCRQYLKKNIKITYFFYTFSNLYHSQIVFTQLFFINKRSMTDIANSVEFTL